MRNAVVVLNCKNWQLSLDAYDFAGNLLATVKPLSHDMRIQDGVLHMDKAANRLAFGYRLESGTTFDNPDKGLLDSMNPSINFENMMFGETTFAVATTVPCMLALSDGAKIRNGL